MREVTANEAKLPEGMSMIYALVDPETKAVRYVGQTRTPGRRRWLHRSRSNNLSGRLVALWIRRLLDVGSVPLMFELETTSEADAAEIRWIAEYRRQGARLLNMNDGGPSLYHCNAAPKSPRHVGWSPLQAYRMRVKDDLKFFAKREMFDALERIRSKDKIVEEKIAKLCKRLGRAKATEFINEQMRLRQCPTARSRGQSTQSN